MGKFSLFIWAYSLSRQMSSIIVKMETHVDMCGIWVPGFMLR